MNGGMEELLKVMFMFFVKCYFVYNSLRISWLNKLCDNGRLYEF